MKYTYIFGLLLACNKPLQEEPSTLEDLTDIPNPSENIPNDTGSENYEEENSITRYYDFDDQDSLLYIQVYKDPNTAAAGLAHDHVMRATNWSGFVSYNTTDISECMMEFSLPVSDLQVDEDAMRELVGYGDTISQSDRETIRGHMLADNQLAASTNPTISFVSSKCENRNVDTFTVIGDMAIKNEVREMSIDIDFLVQSEAMYMSGIINFNHSDFNITPYSAFFGAVKNSEPLRITFDMIGYSN